MRILKEDFFALCEVIHFLLVALIGIAITVTAFILVIALICYVFGYIPPAGGSSTKSPVMYFFYYW